MRDGDAGREMRDGRCGTDEITSKGFYKGRDMHRLVIRQLSDVLTRTPDGKLDGCRRIGPPGVRVTDLGGEELNEATCGVQSRRKQPW
jgi:hypothetical protein